MKINDKWYTAEITKKTNNLLKKLGLLLRKFCEVNDQTFSLKESYSENNVSRLKIETGG